VLRRAQLERYLACNVADARVNGASYTIHLSTGLNTIVDRRHKFIAFCPRRYRCGTFAVNVLLTVV